MEETIFFLKHGLTVEGKPLKDFIDAKNHAEAINFLYDVIKNNRKITPDLIREFNSFLLAGLKTTPALYLYGNKVEKPANPGEYKKQPNHVLQTDGTIHKYVEPLQVASEMEFLCNWIEKNINVYHPIIIAAVAHYNMVRIHPFDDRNGRGARLLMNLILIKNNFPPAVIKNERRREYIQHLSSANKGELNPFIIFIAESCLHTLQMISAELL